MNAQQVVGSCLDFENKLTLVVKSIALDLRAQNYSVAILRCDQFVLKLHNFNRNKNNPSKFIYPKILYKQFNKMRLDAIKAVANKPNKNELNKIDKDTRAFVTTYVDN